MDDKQIRAIKVKEEGDYFRDNLNHTVPDLSAEAGSV